VRRVDEDRGLHCRMVECSVGGCVSDQLKPAFLALWLRQRALLMKLSWGLSYVLVVAQSDWRPGSARHLVSSAD